ncbi:unnamed protein product [Closterium sp. Yama58-4]|nr:unnamed protein product [Closterium sp. Yama58-4]
MDSRLSDLSKWPLDFLWCTDQDWTTESMPSDSAIESALKRDDELLKIHAEFVPVMLSHEEFWKRYFRTVDAIERYPGWTSDQMERQIRSASQALQYSLKKHSVLDNVASCAPSAFLLQNLANAVRDTEPYTSVKELADSIYSPSGVLFRAVEKTFSGSSWLPVATTPETPPIEASLSDCSNEDAVRILFKSGEMDAFTCGCWRALTNFSPNSNHYSSSNGSHLSSSNGSQLSSSNGSPISNHGCCFHEADLDQDRISLPPLREISLSNASGPLKTPPGSPSTACGSPAGSYGRVVLKSLHGAPAGSLAVRLAELMAGIGSPEEMARLWLEVMQEGCVACCSSGRCSTVPLPGSDGAGHESAATFRSTCSTIRLAAPAPEENRLFPLLTPHQKLPFPSLANSKLMWQVRDRWEEGIAIPHVFADREGPDVGVCGVLQQWQVLNCAVARKRWRRARVSSDIQRHLQQQQHLQQPDCFQFFSETAAGDFGDFGRFEPALCKTCGSYNLSEVLLEIPLESPPCGSPKGGSPRRFAEENGCALSEQNGSCSWACFPDASETAAAEKFSDSTGTETKTGFPSIGRAGEESGSESGGMRLLVTGARMCVPEVQDGPLVTSLYLAEMEEAIMHTGSLSIAHKRLFSDMQAFKAANPGCILEDFVRWYSPADWSSDAPSTRMGGGGAEGGAGGDAGGDAGGEDHESNDSSDGDRCEQGQGARSKAGYLSARMSGPDNKWRLYWSEAKPVPALLQPPLFDECEAGARSLEYLESISPTELFIQLFTCLVSVGCAAALEVAPSVPDGSSKARLDDSLKYILHACGRHMTQDRMRYICMVYGAMERIISDNAQSITPGITSTTTAPSCAVLNSSVAEELYTQQTPSVWSYMHDGYTGLPCDGDGDGDRETFEAAEEDPGHLKQQAPSVWTYMNNGYAGLPCNGGPAGEDRGAQSLDNEWSAEFESGCDKSRVGGGREGGCGEFGAGHKKRGGVGGEVEYGYAVEHKGSVLGFLNGDSSGQYQCVTNSEEESARASCDNWACF